MRIGIVASFRNPDEPRGWASIAGYRRVSQLVRLLTPRHEVEVYVLAKRPWSPVVPGSVSTSVLAAPSVLGQWLQLALTLFRQRSRVNLWIAYNPTLSKLPVAAAARLLSAPVVIDYCDKQAAIDHWGRSVRSRIYLCAQLKAERLLLRSSGAFLVISGRLRDELLNVNPRARWLLYRGAFVPREIGDPGLKLLPSCRYILYLGSLYDFNGPSVLVKALSRASASDSCLRLLLVGPGPQEEWQALQALADREGVADRLEFHRGLSDAQVFGLLKQADILALPYLDASRNRFNFPTKLVEYLWASRPILASRVGDIGEVLRAAPDMLLPPGDVEAWASAMLWLSSDGMARLRLAGEAAQIYREQFAPEQVAQTVSGFLEDIAEHKQSGLR
jgi:glycosyltransferase involved in cell wall biosynthesis